MGEFHARGALRDEKTKVGAQAHELLEQDIVVKRVA